ncbi:pleckstrin homology domain-containing family A member 5 isoform X4 [Entelurus aequoreus]|uniref:pleckstrin homology domain-containing family A member 5 isoform X4 n=1 Tax=Entelurus aequoreus TaxID=161455 RepID=UPI002B1DE98A|nr:pleckstrin homology domain-containing family A member 5 isoform X4 [Entelurus aequoreus]
MAADPNPDWLSCLPPSWSYGVTQDGRLFFINEEAKSTTWLQPVSGEAVITGHRTTPDLPTGWEEGYTFEGARCFINHNERKVTCKHPVSGAPSQDNCIFVVNEHAKYGTLVHPDKPLEADTRTAPKTEQDNGDSKDRHMSTMSEASNYTGGSDNSTFAESPATTVTLSSSFTRPSRSSKKVHNFGKRSNSIKRNLNAPVVKSNWLYKQDSTGMKLWKKRWFVLSDMCLFYYRDEKEDSILGSILLPSFHVSMLSVDDHISRKYAFKATHPNMRTYYFCTDTAKEMESWMKVMTDAALVHSEPTKRLDSMKVDQRAPQELNNIQNSRVFRQPEMENNERNRKPVHQNCLSKVDDKRLKDAEKIHSQKEREYYTLQKDMERYCLKQDGVNYIHCKDEEKYPFHRDLGKCSVQKVDEKYTVTPADKNYVHTKVDDKYFLAKDGEKNVLQKVGDRPSLMKDTHKYIPQREVRRQLSLKETPNKYGTLQVVDKYGTLKEVRKYSTLREGDKYANLRDLEKYATLRHGDKFCFQQAPVAETSRTKLKLQPAQAAAIAAAVSASRQGQQANITLSKPAHVTASGSGDHTSDCSLPVERENQATSRVTPVQEQARMSRSNSFQQSEHSTRTHRARGTEEDIRSINSYQTLPRNMPSHRAQLVPRYPEGYRTLPRNSMIRPDSICSTAGSVYDRALRPASTSTVTTAEKRRSMRDDTMWQLYEWQQRQAFSRQSLAQPAGHYGTLPSTKTMGNISEHSAVHSIPASPSHGSLALYNTLPAPCQQSVPNANSSFSEASSPLVREDGTLERRHRTHLAKFGSTLDRRPAVAGVPPQPITPQSLQGKTISPDEYKDDSLVQHNEDIDAKLSRLCEQDRAVRVQEEKLQQLHREKHTLETALLSASQELSEQSNSSTSAAQSLVQQRDVLQNGLLSTCRELSRVNTELERSWREYDKLEGDVTLAKSNLLEQLEALGSPQTEPPSHRHIQIQKELWRIQDVMEALSKNKPQRSTDSTDWSDSKPLSSLQKNEAVTLLPLSPLKDDNGLPPRPPLPQYYYSSEHPPHLHPHHPNSSSRPPPYTQRPEDRKTGSRNGPHCVMSSEKQGPDYRLCKSEPELTTVKEEVDEANSENKDKNESAQENDNIVASKAVPPYPVGIVPPRTKSPMNPPESTTIASYVTLRKTKKPESRSDRPRSAVDQIGYGEREVGRHRMSVEEQMERMRRHQEASSLREKKREALSRSHSFSKDDPYVMLQVARAHTEGACADPVELEAALQQLKMAHNEQNTESLLTTSQEVQRVEEAETDKCEEASQDREMKSASLYPLQPEANNNTENEQCERQRAMILDLGIETQHVEIVNLCHIEDDKSTEEDTPSSLTNANENRFQSPDPQTPSPERTGEADVMQQTIREEKLDKSQAEDKKHNNNNLLASPMYTMVSNDT